MRLLQYNNDGELSLTSFFGDTIPPYAILSHGWGVEEVTFEDLINGTGTEKAGFEKIQFCGKQARRDGLQNFWVDTCCIDKSSSAELTEAVNSMFRWYHESTKCYVYLSDVSTRGRKASDSFTEYTWESFRSSRWFTRGWTLQELIAPTSVEFFSREGVLIGDKSSLEQCICEITGVPAKALRGSPLSDFSIAERMSWAGKRKTTREEDQAYSLLGIFDVHLPLIYGEGSNAFRRLQEEIRKRASISPKSTRAGMRLLVASSDPLRMETVPVSDNLQYAILSHTWGDDEVLFDDMRSATAEQRQGYSKIRQCCNLAFKHGFDYVWVDTCCIDKSSSSELQEAICSMYTWYKSAKICYVYLEDTRYGNVDSFVKCRWFTRGWTLQELIAPAFVEFYDQNWNEIGTKQSLCDQIAQITSIDPLVLRGANPTSRTIAERMSWAANRSTTRTEDAAYSLMGLFNVFMPMLYGEGKRAFIRLQEEIIKQTEDYTIFSWKASIPEATHRGIFAHSPAEFSAVGPGQLVPRFSHPHQQPDQHPPPALTSRGLILTLPVLSYSSNGNTYLGLVSCSSPKEDNPLEDPTLLCIRLREIQSTPQIFARISPEMLEPLAISDLHRFKHQTICVLPSNVDQFASLETPKIGEVVVYPPNDNIDMVAPMQVGVANWALWWDKDKRLTHSYQGGTYPLAAIRFEIGDGFVVVIGFHEEIPWCSTITHEDIKQYGRTFHDLKDLNILSRSYPNCTDRSKKMLSPTRAVAAAMRVARFTDRNASKFGLHVHTSTLETVNSLGILFRDRDQLAETVEIYKQELSSKEKELGAEHTSILQTVNNLGNLYRDQGKPTEAESMYKRALEGYEKALEAEQISTLQTVNNLGNLYRDQGKLADAEEMFVRALAGYEKALGAEHILTLQTINNLGNLYRDQGKLTEAESVYGRALEGYEKTLGAEHTSTLQTVGNLGNLYRDQGKLAEAEEMFVRALAGYEKALGAEHTLTLQTINNLGNLYRDQGKLEQTEPMYERALRGYEMALGPENTRTYVPALNTIWSFGCLFEDRDDFANARNMYSTALVGFEKVVGFNHPSSRSLRDKVRILEKRMDENLDNKAQPEVKEPNNILKRRRSHTGAEETAQQSKRNKLLE